MVLRDQIVTTDKFKVAQDKEKEKIRNKFKIFVLFFNDWFSLLPFAAV